jgi:hypothetical protein
MKEKKKKLDCLSRVLRRFEASILDTISGDRNTNGLLADHAIDSS